MQLEGVRSLQLSPPAQNQPRCSSSSTDPPTRPSCSPLRCPLPDHGLLPALQGDAHLDPARHRLDLLLHRALRRSVTPPTLRRGGLTAALSPPTLLTPPPSTGYAVGSIALIAGESCTCLLARRVHGVRGREGPHREASRGALGSLRCRSLRRMPTDQPGFRLARSPAVACRTPAREC